LKFNMRPACFNRSGPELPRRSRRSYRRRAADPAWSSFIPAATAGSPRIASNPIFALKAPVCFRRLVLFMVLLVSHPQQDPKSLT
jgi:hypothetical protein